MCRLSLVSWTPHAIELRRQGRDHQLSRPPLASHLGAVSADTSSNWSWRRIMARSYAHGSPSTRHRDSGQCLWRRQLLAAFRPAWHGRRASLAATALHRDEGCDYRPTGWRKRAWRAGQWVIATHSPNTFVYARTVALTPVAVHMRSKCSPSTARRNSMHRRIWPCTARASSTSTLSLPSP